MRGRKKKNETRDAILRCAAQVFAQREFHEVLTDDIAQQLGIGKGTIYRYFDSKEQLYLETVAGDLDGLHAAVARVVEDGSPGAPLDVSIESLARVMIEYFWKRRDFFLLMARLEPKLKASERADWQRRRAESMRMVSRWLDRAVARGEIAKINTRLAVEALFGMLRGVCIYRADSDRPEELTRVTTALFLRGIGLEAAATPARGRVLKVVEGGKRRSMARTGMMATCLLLAIAGSGCGRGSVNHAAAADAEASAVAAEILPAAIPVTVAAVEVQPSARLVNLVGTLFGDEQVTISSQVEGQIKALGADLGDEVRAGDVLAQVDDDQWNARLREADATLAKAKSDEERGRQLVSTNVISAQEYEGAKTRVDVAAAQRDTLRVTIQHARAVSPLNASVARRFASVGEYVRPGTPLFTLVVQDPLKLRGDVPERFSNELKIGQNVQVRVDAFPAEVFTGKLTRISPASNPDNRSVAIEASVDNRARKLKAGFFASAGVVTRSDDRALMVPQDAIISFAGVTKLFVIVGEKAQERNVQLGTRGSAGLVEIVDGVAAGEQVAISGLSKLEDGVTVMVKETATAAIPAP